MQAGTWLWLSIAAGVLAVVYGVISMLSILKLPAGNARMQEIAAAIQAGAKAYLNRQYSTITVVGVLLFVVLGFALNWATAGGFALGAILSGLAGVFLAGHFVTWITSLELTTVAASVVLVATQPVWVALLSIPLLGERPSGLQWVGLLLAVAGAAYVGWGDFASDPGTLRGDLLALAGAVLAAAYYVLGRGLRRRMTIWPYVGVVYGAATVTLVVVMLGTATPFVGYPRTDWLVFLALAIGPMMIGHTGQNWALRYLPAYAVNVSILGEPIGATLIAWLLPGIREEPPVTVLVGGVLILAGILLGMRRGRGVRVSSPVSS